LVLGFSSWMVIGFGLGACALLLIAIMANLYRKAAPNEALIVYGFRGSRIVVDGGTVIFPLVENYQKLSLQLMSFEVAPQQNLHTSEGAIVAVGARAQGRVKTNPRSHHSAARWVFFHTLQHPGEVVPQKMVNRQATL